MFFIKKKNLKLAGFPGHLTNLKDTMKDIRPIADDSKHEGHFTMVPVLYKLFDFYLLSNYLLVFISN